jgi:hypothetical protein
MSPCHRCIQGLLLVPPAAVAELEALVQAREAPSAVLSARGGEREGGVGGKAQAHVKVNPKVI